MAVIGTGARIQYVGGGRFSGDQFFVREVEVERAFSQLRVGDVGVVHSIPGVKGDLGCTFGQLRVSLNVEDVRLAQKSHRTKSSLSRGSSLPKLSPARSCTTMASKFATSPDTECREQRWARVQERLPPLMHDKGSVRTEERSPVVNSEVAQVVPPSDSAEDVRPHPPSFYCPISHQCMHDPVVLTDGHTYERRHIERWLKSKQTSPVSGMPLTQTSLVPNHALRNAIEEYFAEVLSNHRQAIRQVTDGLHRDGHFSSNAQLIHTIDSLMQCSILVNADLSIELVLKRIMEEAKSLVGAEVASAFLVDRENQELFSTVNSTGGELRIPMNSGIAGHVAYSGLPVIIHDAYTDVRFNTAVDTQTGFRTRNILCVPICGGVKGGIIGVAQLVNKTDSGVLHGNIANACDFTDDDLQFFQVLAAQGGAAIVSSGMFESMPCVGGERRMKSKMSAARSLSFRMIAPEVDSAESPHVAPVLDMVENTGEEIKRKVGRGGSRASLKPAKLRTLEPLVASSSETWEMDTLSLAELSENNPLSLLGEHLLEESGVIDVFGLDSTKVRHFLEAIQDGYSDSNPYHNKAHGASVVHFMYQLLSSGGVAEAVAPTVVGAVDGNEQRARHLVMLAGLLAAIIHDFEHDGVNNGFLINTSSPKAIRYNDRSPNENHHVTAAFELLMMSEFNFLEHLVQKEYRELRKLVVEMVLGTDMAESGKLVKALQEATSGAHGAFAVTSAQDGILSLQMALKCSDLGHLALGWTTHLRWVQRLEQEFYAQGDSEKKLGMFEISFLCDPDKPGVSESQMGFLNFMALPVFRTFVSAFPKASPMLVAVETNATKWSVIESRA